MEVGIEDCLHIEFEYNKGKYHLKDAVLGKIFFLLVRIKIKHMEIAIIKRESTGTGTQQRSAQQRTRSSAARGGESGCARGRVGACVCARARGARRVKAEPLPRALSDANQRSPPPPLPSQAPTRTMRTRPSPSLRLWMAPL